MDNIFLIIRFPRNSITLGFIIMLFLSSSISLSINASDVKEHNNILTDPLSITINIPQNSLLYEGDVLNCTIIGTPLYKYWQIENFSKHTSFYGNNPVLFDVEPTPLNQEQVNLTVYVENKVGYDSDTIKVTIKRIYFGDLQFHSSLSDGYHDIDKLYRNAIADNYLDFVCLTDHAEVLNQQDITPPKPVWLRIRIFLQVLKYLFTDYDEWQIVKEKVKEYYDPGRFTTFLGYEYSSGPWYPGGFPSTPDGHEDVGHICFIYRDVYDEAPEFSSWEKYTFDDIFKAMDDEWDKGHFNIGFPHHPLMKIGNWGSYTINWSFLANNITQVASLERILRGVETYSKWGVAIGKYSNIPLPWMYDPDNCNDQSYYWVENSLWEWSENQRKNVQFSLMASSDNHAADRPGSASLESRISKTHPNPSGIVAAFAVHNTREEIWDALNSNNFYASQLLKMRVNVRVDDEIGIGKWINCSIPLKFQITALSTFPGFDSGNKQMTPHGYLPSELDYPISDIWIVKKDTDKGQPWCKVIYHGTPDSHLAVVTYEDFDVKPNDFYYIAIRQQGQQLEINRKTSGRETDEYMAYIGPIFIDQVEIK